MTYTSEIEKLERRWSENPKGRNFAPLADAYRKAGELDRAIELCTAGLERHPDYVSAHIVFGRCLMDQKNDAGAADVFRKVLALDPENVLALKILGEIAVRGGRYDEAVDWLTRLLAADPMNGDAADLLSRVKSKAAQQAAPSPAPGARTGAAEPVVQFVPEAAAARPASGPATVRTAAPAARPAGRATAPAPPRSPAPPAPPLPPAAARLAAQADFIVEHVSDRPAPPDPTAASADKEIEIFDGAVDFNAVAHDAAKAEGLEVQEEVELKPQDYVVEGLARTQYESGMYARPPAGPEPEEEQPTVELPLFMPDEEAEETAPAATPPPAAPAWAAPRGPAATTRRPTPTPAPPPPPAPAPPPTPPPTPAAVALSDDDGAADTAALSRAEPVLTETMAELYLRQGHEENALRVYQALLAQRPGDARLRARVAGLMSGGTGPRAFAGDRGQGMGESVPTFLRRILAGRPGMRGASLVAPPEPVPAPPAPEPPPPPAPAPVFADSPLDGAFAIAEPEPEPVRENRSPGPGEATRPAEDSISLDSVFGEETLRMSAPSAEPPQAQSAPEPAGPPTTGGFSFDQFFGPAGPTQGGAAAGAAGAAGTAEPKGPPRSSGSKPRAVEDEGDLDQFQAWLRGLKS